MKSAPSAAYTGVTITYFHGTNIQFHTGDILLPGATVGTSHHGRSNHVYATHPFFSLSEAHWVGEGIRTSTQYALDIAFMWGAYAADNTCLEDVCNFGSTHYDPEGLHLGSISECVKIYTVDPLGTIEFDDAHDGGPEGIRTTSARIIAELQAEDIRAIFK